MLRMKGEKKSARASKNRWRPFRVGIDQGERGNFKGRGLACLGGGPKSSQGGDDSQGSRPRTLKETGGRYGTEPKTRHRPGWKLISAGRSEKNVKGRRKSGRGVKKTGGLGAKWTGRGERHGLYTQCLQYERNKNSME